MVDFQQLTTELNEEFGLTQIEIAIRCGCSQQAIAAIKHRPGSEPRWSVGDTLIKLHAAEKRKAEIMRRNIMRRKRK